MYRHLFLFRIFTVLSTCCFYFSLYSCNSRKADALFQKLPSSASGIDFTNELTYSDSLSVLEFEYMFNGAGVALLDINRDGLQDVFFSGNMVSCRLYLNKGNLKFEDITEKAGLKTKGWANGASVVDINQDGYPDIYVCKAGNRNTPPGEMHNQFFINNGNNTFTDKAAEMGLDDDGYDIHTAFFDYDKDGDLDMYLLRNAFVNYNRNNVRAKTTDGKAISTDKLYRNNGNSTFTDVSREAGISIEGFGLGVSVCDLNNDNWPDLYVSNDFLTNDLVWMNNGDGTFSNKASAMLRHQTYNGMGNDVADYNNDGLEDIMVVDMLPPENKHWKQTMRGNTYEEFQYGLSYGYEPQYVRNTLQLNNGNGTFSEIGQLSGVNATEWSWAPLLADFDNDGLKDLFVSNGYRQDITNLDFIVYGKKALFIGTPEANRRERMNELKKVSGIKIANYIFRNNGDLTFKDKSADWGMDDAGYSNGAAYGDLDNDGDLDLVINNLDEAATIYKNRSNELHKNQSWLRIQLKGPSGNQDGVGAKVLTWQGTEMQYHFFSPYRGYLSTVEPFVHIGLKQKPLDSVKIVWPDGKEQLLQKPQTNRLLTIKYADANEVGPKQPNQQQTMFLNVSNNVGISYKHKEDDFVDFKMQPLVPHMLSHEGPGISVNDVNGDGLEDFFAGGAAGSRGAIFLQQKNGSFAQQMLADSNASDNMGSLFFDADSDGDADLYVVSGGVSAKKNGDPVYQHRFYRNDGRGNFTADAKALPPINTSGSVVTASDYDHDGDLDLFVGGRVSPGEYPVAPKSFLLRNDTKSGQCSFSDVTHQSGLDASGLGMVTSALWTDTDNDGWQDLIVTGEFMPIRIFKNVKGRLTEISEQSSLKNTHGWWNSITGGDFDNDGDIDYVLGNAGLNGPLKATAEEPVCIYAKDYDKNGRLDPIMCHYLQGKEYIAHARDDINKQITPMRARFRDYESYANVTFREAFRDDEIKGAYVVKCQTFASAYLENLGKGKFVLKPLPLEAQFSPVYGMVSEDFNGDGNLDVLCVGNSYATEVQTGRYDAQGSLLLLNNGRGKFTVDRKSANWQGDNKSVVRLTANGSSMFLVGSNSDSLRAYQFHRKAVKTIPVDPGDAFAMIVDQHGRKRRHEFYYGNSYLSQSSRQLVVHPATKSIVIYNNTGGSRTVNF